MSRAEKMYKNSPKLERDEKDGKVKSVKPTPKEKEAARVGDGTEGMAMHENLHPMARHAVERHQMHSRHEMDHSMHPSHEDKKAMHARHLKEKTDMYKKHEKELSSKA